MTDLESAQKIGQETTRKFSEISKIAFYSVIQINTRSVIRISRNRYHTS